MSEEDRDIVISHLQHFSFKQDEFIFKQGNTASYYFIIAKGCAEVIINGNRIKDISIGDSFGELALLHNTKRSASVRAVTPCEMWGVDRETFRNAVEKLNDENFEENHEFISTVPIFNHLSKEQHDALVQTLTPLKFGPDQTIVREGDSGELFYIIKEGVVRCLQNGKEIRRMLSGDFFGEQALLYQTARTASIVTITECKCLAIGRENLESALGNNLRDIIYKNSLIMAFEKDPLLAQLTMKQMTAIAYRVKIRQIQPQNIVFSAGTEIGDKIWVVLKGNPMQSGETIAEQQTCLGTEGLIGKTFSFIDPVTAEGSELDLAEISREEIEEAIGGNLHDILHINGMLKIFKNIHIFKSLTENKLIQLINSLVTVSYEPNERIFTEKDPGDTFYIIKSGHVDIYKNGTLLRSFDRGNYFGERSILYHEKRSATVIAQDNVELFALAQNTFLSCIDEAVRTQLYKRIELQDDSITLKQLRICNLLGKGMFGNVFLAKHKTKEIHYALKTVHRNKIKRFNLELSLILERNVLLQLDHPMIMKLVKTFKDEERLYFLTEFVQGQELFEVLRVLGLLKPVDCKFYAACTVLILEHLHDRNIIYRDLKPENIMIDASGFPKLIDFGTAKIVERRTYSIVGTPHYMAPEVILGRGYGVQSDYWSMGVMFYEFVCGGVPFGEDETDPYNIYELVLERKIVWPKFLDKSDPIIKIIDQLMHKNPAMRMPGGLEEFKSNKWFGTTNWESLLMKTCIPPYIPTLEEVSSDIKKGKLGQIIGRHESVVNLDELKEHKRPPRAPIPDDWDDQF